MSNESLIRFLHSLSLAVVLRSANWIFAIKYVQKITFLCSKTSAFTCSIHHTMKTYIWSCTGDRQTYVCNGLCRFLAPICLLSSASKCTDWTPGDWIESSDKECTDYVSLLNGLGEPVNGLAPMILVKITVFGKYDLAENCQDWHNFLLTFHSIALAILQWLNTFIRKTFVRNILLG